MAAIEVNVSAPWVQPIARFGCAGPPHDPVQPISHSPPLKSPCPQLGDQAYQSRGTIA